MIRDCTCPDCPPPSPLVVLLGKLSLEFAGMAEDMTPELGTRALATADALMMLSKHASQHGDESVVGLIEVVEPVVAGGV